MTVPNMLTGVAVAMAAVVVVTVVVLLFRFQRDPICCPRCKRRTVSVLLVIPVSDSDGNKTEFEVLHCKCGFHRVEGNGQGKDLTSDNWMAEAEAFALSVTE